MGGANGCQELGSFLAVCLCVLVGSGFDGFGSESMLCVAMPTIRVPFMGRPAFTFIGQDKARIIVAGKEENEKEKSSRIIGSFFSFTWVLLTL